MSAPLNKSYRKSTSFVGRIIADELLLVPIRRGVGDLESIYTLDGIALRLWDLLDGQKSVADLLSLVVDEYDVESLTAETDILEFIAQLESLGAIEEA